MEIESLQRKKNQIDWIASEMLKKWHFKKIDGTIMSATSESCEVSTWSGSSTWEGERWLRDETKPGTNDYYVKTITWKPNEKHAKRPRPRGLHVPLSFPQIPNNHGTNIRVSRLESAGVPEGLPADETLRRVEESERTAGSIDHIDIDTETAFEVPTFDPEDDHEPDDDNDWIDNDNENGATFDPTDQEMTQDSAEEHSEHSQQEGGDESGTGLDRIDEEMTQDTLEEHSEHGGDSDNSNDDFDEDVHEFDDEDSHHDGSEDEYDGYWNAGSNSTGDLAHSDEEFEEEDPDSEE